MPSTPRARRSPGPLLVFAGAMLLAGGVVLSAHDPGLSSLDVTVTGSRLSAKLSVSAADVELAALGAGGGESIDIGQLALNAIRLRIDDQIAGLVLDRAWMEGGAAYALLSVSAASLPGARLTISSEIPAQLARGHRQLLTVRQADRVVVEKLLDAGSGA